MNKTEYEALIETISDEHDIELSDKLLEKLVNRAYEVEQEGLTYDDIFDELKEVVPEDFRDEDNWQSFLSELSDDVYDAADDEEAEEYDDSEDDDDE